MRRAGGNDAVEFQAGGGWADGALPTKLLLQRRDAGRTCRVRAEMVSIDGRPRTGPNRAGGSLTDPVYVTVMTAEAGDQVLPSKMRAKTGCRSALPGRHQVRTRRTAWESATAA